MTKKTRSPAKQPSSPNPRPKQRNRQTSVDRFFALKPSSRAKINEAMSGNTAESPSASDTKSNNPYDVLRDDEDEEPTNIDQKESDEDEDTMSTQNSAPIMNPLTILCPWVNLQSLNARWIFPMSAYSQIK
jgi:hypothetical protein